MYHELVHVKRGNKYNHDAKFKSIERCFVASDVAIKNAEEKFPLVAKELKKKKTHYEIGKKLRFSFGSKK